MGNANYFGGLIDNITLLQTEYYELLLVCYVVEE
jgi:hypothetical protein